MDTKAMHKCGWLFPALIVAVNAAMILILWSTLQEYLPAHFDLEGNASGSIPRTTLLYYPLIGAVIGLVAYWIRCRVDKKYSKDVGLEPRPEDYGSACRIDGKGC